ncbi:MAG: DUF2079 domain-containing protein [Streptosporangiaceae bacterium]
MPVDESSAEVHACQSGPGGLASTDDGVASDGAGLDTADALGRPVAAEQDAAKPAVDHRANARSQPSPADGVTQGTTRLWDPATGLIASGVVAAYTVISVFRYLRRDPTSWDLGINTQLVKGYADLHAPIGDIVAGGFNLFGDHFNPILALIAPFFRLFPSPVTLLVAQALLAGVSVLPISQLGRELLGTAAGRSVAAAYGLSWGLEQMANFDFHDIAFAVALLAFSMSAMVRGRTRAAVLWALPLVFVKEDQGFTLLAIGLIMAFGYRRYGPGLFLSCWGLLWSLVAMFVIIPHFNAQHTYDYWTQAGALNPLGGHFSLGRVWSTISQGASVKLPTLAMILLPTAFIALRSPVVLAAVPSLAIRALLTLPDYWSTAWHYNATVMPIVFIAAIDAMARISSKRRPASRLAVAASRYGAAAMLAICAALAFQFPLSDLWTPATYTLGPHVTAENQAMARVPDGATVSTDLDLLAPLAARTDTFWLGTSGSDPATQYVVFDTQSTDCSAWETVCAQADTAGVLRQVESLEHGSRYRQIFASNGVFVLRRVG